MTEFSNFENGKILFNWTKEKYEEMQRYYERKVWNSVVRTSQEVVELSLRAILKTLGIDYPKERDVGEIFMQVLRDKKYVLMRKILNEIKNISQ